MAGRGDSDITNRGDDRRSLRRVELNLCGTGANTASEREHGKWVSLIVAGGASELE